MRLLRPQAPVVLVTALAFWSSCAPPARDADEPPSPCEYGPSETALRVENRLYPELEHADTGTATVPTLAPLRLEQGALAIEVEPAPAAGLLAPGQEVELLLYGVCTGGCQYYLRLSEPDPGGAGALLAAAWTGMPPPQRLVSGVVLDYERANCPLSEETCANEVTPLVLVVVADDGSRLELGPQREKAFAGYRIVNGHSRVAQMLTCPNQRSMFHAGTVYRMP